VEGIAQATVVAPDTATADVLATVCCVLEAEESLALAERFGVACLIVEAAGKVHRNPGFEALEANP
jgi:thiamine biosynthesis lipoprotein